MANSADVEAAPREWPRARAVDAAVESRPGVPMERDARHVAADHGPAARWDRPVQQRGAAILARSGLRSATPVFGTAQPARGLSGVVRRAAYRIPDHRSSRWVLLVMGDRLDVLEHRLARGAWLLPLGAAVVAGYIAVARRR